MKNLRYILVGLIIGGAVGAKMGAYLADLFQAPASTNYVESGFLFGAATGSLAVAIFLFGYAIASIQHTERRDYTQNELAGSAQ